MRARLEPIAEGIQAGSTERPRVDSYAIMGRAEMTALAQAMRDAQSAILFCLAWHAAVQVRMKRGPLANQRVARVSAGTLAKITGRSIRTVRHALSRLKAAGVIEREDSRPGRTSIYQMSFHNDPLPVALAESSLNSVGQEEAGQ
jgi:DNA-binding transcriptional ArsR family regulator